jgi:hypothetical protein
MVPFIAEYKNITGRFTTTGGVASRFGFSGMQTPPYGRPHVIPDNRRSLRRFRQPHETGPEPGAPGLRFAVPNKNFQWPKDNILPDSQIVIQPGDTSAQFYYYDEMSSYPIGEKGRPGAWTLKAQNLTIDATGSLIIDPAATDRLTFTNLVSTQVAGKVYDEVGVYHVFKLETHDAYENPTISTTNSIFVDLSADRLPSGTSDYYGFSLTSGTDAEYPWVETTRVEISTDSYFVNFYYKDTRASDSYLPPYSRPVIQAQAVDHPWHGHQTTVIAPDWISQISFISPQQVLTAGVTSQIFTIQTQDRYSNASAIKPSQSDPYQGGKLSGSPRTRRASCSSTPTSTAGIRPRAP